MLTIRNRRKYRGLGDVVEHAAEVSKIKAAVKRLAGDRDCGCEKRRDALNKMVPFRNTETENESKGDSNA